MSKSSDKNQLLLYIVDFLKFKIIFSCYQTVLQNVHIYV